MSKRTRAFFTAPMWSTDQVRSASTIPPENQTDARAARLADFT